MKLGGTGWELGVKRVGTGSEPGESGRNWVNLGGTGRNWVDLGRSGWNWEDLGGTGRNYLVRKCYLYLLLQFHSFMF